MLDVGRGIRFPLTEQPLSVYPDDASGPDAVLVSPGQSVQALDARTGEPLWTRAASVSQAARYDGALTLLLWSDEDTTLEQLDPSDGEPTWTTRWAGVSGAQSYLVDGSLLLVGTSTDARAAAGDSGDISTDRLAQIDLHDGTLHELPWPEGLTGSAWFYVRDHRLYAYSFDQPGLIRIG